MAEIRVEKKSRPVWPWILAILLAAAVIWIVVDNDDPRMDNQVAVTNSDDTLQNNSNSIYDRNGGSMANNDAQNAATAYLTYIQQNGDNMTVEHSQQALTRLSKALNSIAMENNATDEVRQELDKLREETNKLSNNPGESEHADIMANAFASAANILDNLQEKQFPELNDEVQEVQDAAKKVKSNQVVSNQKEAVNSFFEKSAETIESMTEDV